VSHILNVLSVCLFRSHPTFLSCSTDRPLNFLCLSESTRHIELSIHFDVPNKPFNIYSKGKVSFDSLSLSLHYILWVALRRIFCPHLSLRPPLHPNHFCFGERKTYRTWASFLGFLLLAVFKGRPGKRSETADCTPKFCPQDPGQYNTLATLFNSRCYRVPPLRCQCNPRLSNEILRRAQLPLHAFGRSASTSISRPCQLLNNAHPFRAALEQDLNLYCRSFKIFNVYSDSTTANSKRHGLDPSLLIIFPSRTSLHFSGAGGRVSVYFHLMLPR
jgi:hypothetical protein